MNAVRRLDRAELERRLKPYRCRFRAQVTPKVELWVTGWDWPFTLRPDDGYYDERDYERARAVIAASMPPDWSPDE